MKNGSIIISLKSKSGAEASFDTKTVKKVIEDVVALDDYVDYNLLTVEGSKDTLDNAVDYKEGACAEKIKGDYE